MLAAIVLLLTVSPVRETFTNERAARAACHLWWSNTEHKCRDEDVEILGDWDPRPSPDEWPTNAYVSPPPDFGAYNCEKEP